MAVDDRKLRSGARQPTLSLRAVWRYSICPLTGPVSRVHRSRAFAAASTVGAAAFAWPAVARAELHDAAQRVAEAWRSVGASVVVDRSRFLTGDSDDERPMVIVLPPLPEGKCTTIVLLGARGLGFHVKLSGGSGEEAGAKRASAGALGRSNVATVPASGASSSQRTPALEHWKRWSRARRSRCLRFGPQFSERGGRAYPPPNRGPCRPGRRPENAPTSRRHALCATAPRWRSGQPGKRAPMARGQVTRPSIRAVTSCSFSRSTRELRSRLAAAGSISTRRCATAPTTDCSRATDRTHRTHIWPLVWAKRRTSEWFSPARPRASPCSSPTWPGGCLSTFPQHGAVKLARGWLMSSWRGTSCRSRAIP